MKKYTLALLSLFCFIAVPVQASTMPQADFSGFKLGLGTSPGFSLDFALAENFSLGGSVAMPFFYGAFGFTRYDGHLNYRFMNNESMDVSVILGVFGDINTSQREDLKLSPVGIQFGLGVAYHFNEQFSLRVNIVPGVAFPNSTGWGLFPPGGGIEVGYHPIPQLEVTGGFNGNGDIFGFNYRF
ncbi:hypothetical protein COW36_08495 [bacterium (Candidatus Blackallbacteria) CG17_big_fil_post_rev_8_21_14_2_50_48_46]|uniref:Outer membrane protein beta-barrel domain-containing protein n=1 Tax=bacterium (Candidatus Blackallbacteria) CG17_big_fil_post_rev_8_21_14_2_50_48_46 TaxID=2014261 RepID=A0A2M7G762_9BACT|nr:MAG: hypothetical protein COW64_05795 [bacterium (Candidatus Blackallbacteria) CG18_big_fil_WC_8_21_14_2_50_49_26]PIW17526.1 MAG: hypothetical protein COW36_08495 [bacterium (Candidatus Blackallbacteria) CG17_big_fil_post_rev_8_21_14_2_50_48_46]PIW48380.1 MAG: hypothetical protein COW20_09845 [bacterium (Candidatus Blackallbacteria) CG13_big_fil_rev_8_21_14_2_50_49_14]